MKEAMKAEPFLSRNAACRKKKIRYRSQAITIKI